MFINCPERTLIPTAEIVVVLRDFNPIGDGCTNAEIELKSHAHRLVRQEKRDGTIVVYGSVRLEFNVVGARLGDTQDGVTYAPVGIGFEETPDDETEKEYRRRGAWPTLADASGLKAFPMRATVSANGTTLLAVLDLNPAPACFKFSLMIQRSDGALGIIDPKIRNWPM